MTESSIFWTTGSTGDGASPYTQAQCILWLRQTFCGADNEGVLKDYLNELATTGASSPVATNTGGAYVYGFPYNNSVSVNTAIPTPSSNTRIDLIVLRASWAAQTIRITRIAGSEGGGAPSLTQTDGTTWDIPLAQASITTGGTITVTDTREFLHPNIAVDGDMIDDDAVDSQHYTDGSIDTAHIGNLQVTLAKLAADSVDDTKAGSRVPQFYRRQGNDASSWAGAGSTTYTPGAVRMQAGALSISGNGAVTFPQAFSQIPLVFATSRSTTAVHATIFGPSTTGFTIYIWKADGDPHTTPVTVVHWRAIGAE